MNEEQIFEMGIQMMVNARRELDRIALECGMTQEEIQAVVTDALKDVTINGERVFV